jgi:hypothetical protein
MDKIVKLGRLAILVYRVKAICRSIVRECGPRPCTDMAIAKLLQLEDDKIKMLRYRRGVAVTPIG